MMTKQRRLHIGRVCDRWKLFCFVYKKLSIDLATSYRTLDVINKPPPSQNDYNVRSEHLFGR